MTSCYRNNYILIDKNYVLPRIFFSSEILDIYTMKDTVYIKDKEKDFSTSETSKKPLVVALTISIILILLLNLITTIIFY
ncbi:hypothetical protein LS48_03410 [Aequorivita aquimaris]|uniref:Uncharacterized protein n=1 Tax=Aequorivita aquimaris TaxID=1548749 RepID=A0A137RJW3_9FLAO|nr:hypothetical protein LS48_03410 [Aequorivita aquimaris]